MQRMGSFFQTKLSQWKTSELAMILILAIGAFLRLWNFSNTLQFLGDQGRDAMTVNRIVVKHTPILLGPVTSTGNMYLGPLYYYMMAPFLSLSYPSPIGPAYGVALLSILTLLLMYYLGKELIGERAAIIATAGMAFSATVITFARFSWNPNPAPFFGLLLLWGIYRALKKNPWYWTLVALCISVLMQLHYIALLTLPFSGLIWLYHLFTLRKDKPKIIQLLYATGVSIFIFLLFLSPLVVFDYRHDFINARSFTKFLSDDNSPLLHATGPERMLRIVKETHGRSLQLFFETIIGQNRSLNTFLLVTGIIYMLYLAFRRVTRNKKNSQDTHQFFSRILLLFFFISILGLSVYQGNVYFHYIAFLFPAVFLAFGIVIDQLLKYKIGQAISAVIIAGFLLWNAQHMPLQDLGWKVSDMKRTSDTILERVQPGEKYNIVLFSETKDSYGQNYRYFLSVSDRPPISSDNPALADTLYVINEQHLEGDVLNQPIYEISIFPNKVPREIYTVPNGPEITVLKR